LRPLPIWVRSLLVAVSVAVLAEVKVNPFGTPFRFALGAATFNFACILDPSLPVLPTGAVTSLVVLTLRLSLSAWGMGATWREAFLTHFPGALYYLFLAIFLTGLDFRRQKDRPLPLGLTLIAADALANQGEILIRGEVESWAAGLYFFGLFLVIGFIRTTMVLGLYYVVEQKHLEELQEQEQSKYREMLLLATALRNEAFFLKKSAADIEKTMARSYQLYHQTRTMAAKREGEPAPEERIWREISSNALTVAKDIHEIKKDYQRIIAGLEKLIDPQEIGGPGKMSEVVELALAVNKNYAQRLKKQINFVGRIQVDGLLADPLPLLTILNNLLNNAIEAIPERGEVVIEILQEAPDVLLLKVTDDGVGIPTQDREIIFEPGYTTKFTPETGEFFSGIGLTHVRGLVEDLGGRIEVTSGDRQTTFLIRLPLSRVFQKAPS